MYINNKRETLTTREHNITIKLVEKNVHDFFSSQFLKIWQITLAEKNVHDFFSSQAPI